MSERVSTTAEILPLEEALRQRDEFLAAAREVDGLFKAETGSGAQANGHMSITWKLPEGYHLEVAHVDGREYYSVTMFHDKEGSFGGQHIQRFNSDHPMVVHVVDAFPSATSQLRYELNSKPDNGTHQAFTLFDASIEQFNLQPVTDSVEA